MILHIEEPKESTKNTQSLETILVSLLDTRPI